MNSIYFWVQYASNVNDGTAWDLQSALDACQTVRPERPRCFFGSAIYQLQRWLTCSLRGISVCLAKQSVAKWSPLWDGPPAFRTWHLCVACVSVFESLLKPAFDTIVHPYVKCIPLFPCSTCCANNSASRDNACLSHLFKFNASEIRPPEIASGHKTWTVIIWLIINALLPKNKRVNNSLWFSTNSISDFISRQCSQ